MKMKYLYSFVMILIMLSCTDDPKFPSKTVEGYRPIYSNTQAISLIESRTIHNPGKILRYKDILLVTEVNEGIHILNNSNPSSPVTIGFLKIVNNVNIALQDSFLIVDHQSSLVSLNISNINSIKETSSIKVWSITVPPREGFYFECIDPRKGEVIGWDLVQLTNPQCYR